MVAMHSGSGSGDVGRQLIPVSIYMHQALSRAGFNSLLLVYLANEGEGLPWEVAQELRHGIRARRPLLILAAHREDSGIQETAELLKAAGFMDFAIAICDFQNNVEGPEICRALGLWNGVVSSRLVSMANGEW